MVIRNAIVTGAARGIGRAITEALLDRGWQVAALDLDIGPLEAREGLQAIRCDLGSEDDVRSAVAEAGFETIDLLVNNGGPADPECGPLEELTLEAWHKWIDPHLTGTFLMTREALPALRKGRGAVVNMASTRALQSEPDTFAYAAAKGGVTSLTHAMAVSLGPEVRVNAIAPGWINSRGEALGEADHAQHPVGRVGEPSDIAEAVLYLADAGFVTGQVLVVDGGMTRKMIYT